MSIVEGHRGNERTGLSGRWIRRGLLALFITITSITAVSAQEATEPPAPEPQAVEVQAADELVLKGDYYAPESDAAPAVLLLHQLNSSRSSWSPLIPALLDEGYAALAVDLRGHGQTGGANDWDAAVGDVQTWLDWLREQPGVRAEAVSVIGASIGSNLALVGCGNDAACVTAIALSPGTDYFGVTTEDAVSAGLRRRSALLVSARNDHPSIDGVLELFALARGEIGVQIYNDGIHGTSMFHPHGDSLIPLIVNWLNAHTPEEE
jgi:alpha-beta hydrolase superfamily lysophospholipase